MKIPEEKADNEDYTTNTKAAITMYRTPFLFVLISVLVADAGVLAKKSTDKKIRFVSDVDQAVVGRYIVTFDDSATDQEVEGSNPSGVTTGRLKLCKSMIYEAFSFG